MQLVGSAILLGSAVWLLYTVLRAVQGKFGGRLVVSANSGRWWVARPLVCAPLAQTHLKPTLLDLKTNSKVRNFHTPDLMVKIVVLY